jgi:hypothetical protein
LESLGDPAVHLEVEESDFFLGIVLVLLGVLLDEGFEILAGWEGESGERLGMVWGEGRAKGNFELFFVYLEGPWDRFGPLSR